MLEKHGLLDVEVADAAALTGGNALERPGVTVIARLPEEVWTAELVEAVAGSFTPVLVEGPLTPTLERALGLGPAIRVDGEARLAVVDGALEAAAAAYGARPLGTLGPPASRPVPRPAELEWSALPDLPLTAARAEAWRAPGWELGAWPDAGGSAVLAELGPASGTTAPAPAAGIVRRRAVVACSFGLLGFLGQTHTSEPFPAGEHLSSPPTIGLEGLLLALLDQLHADAGLTRARVLPWPAGVRWALSVRHDFDRPLDAPAVRDVLMRHRRLGTAATWYWRACHLRGRDRARGRQALAQVARDPAHEIALHTDRLWTEELERPLVELVAGARIVGSSAHGNPECTRFQGAPNVLWADREGLEYTELIRRAHLHPHRFAALGPDGEIEPLRVLCLPHHESFDRTAQGGDVGSDRLDRLGDRWVAPGGFAQVLSHPDINLDALFAALEALPREERVDWTAAQAVDWWRRTHVATELRVERDGPAAFTLRSARGASGVVLELRDPDGRARHHVLELPAGEPVTVGGGGGRAPSGGTPAPLIAGTLDARAAEARRTWDRELAPVAAERIRAWHERRGLDPDSAAARSTVMTNTDLVPGRWRDLTRMLDGLPPQRLAGARVLEAGAGFGALATYAALATGARSVLGVDTDPTFVAVGRELAAAARKAGDLRFEEADLRRLDSLPDGSIDLVVANNAMVYLREPAELRVALRALHRVLSPDGRVLVHQANRLRLRDPFTGTLLAHLLPAPLARSVPHSSRDRILLLSPRSLRRELTRAGFADVRTGAIRHGRVTSRPAHHAARFVFAVARRPG